MVDTRLATGPGLQVMVTIGCMLISVTVVAYFGELLFLPCPFFVITVEYLDLVRDLNGACLVGFAWSVMANDRGGCRA